MSEQSKPHLEELQTALENIKQIRGVLFDVEKNEPLRVMFRRLMWLGYVFAPMFILLGITSQYIYDTKGTHIWGWPKGQLITWMFISSFVFLGLLKNIFLKIVAERYGYTYKLILKSIFTTGYPRLFTPMFLMGTLCTICFVQMGRADLVVGLWGMIVGAVWLAVPLVFPAPETTHFSLTLLIASGISLFVYPEYPFYKVSVLFGGATAWMGFLGQSIIQQKV